MNMKYYPVCLDIKGRQALVVGGGLVGARKASTLAKCGANVTIVSPEFTDSLDNGKKENITLIKKEYTKKNLNGMFLVIGATNNAELNRKIWSDAKNKNMLCNIADLPEACNFILPAIVRRGDLMITVSTSGSSPAFAKKLKKDLEIEFGEEYAEFLFLMGKIRKKLLAGKHAPDEHKSIFEEFIAKGLLEMIAQKNYSKIDALLLNILGRGYSYNNLLYTENENDS
ncbi:MAG: bifunctional precorrin-2 dehydrogenase/sirohydrochlorin ferrochelatase [Thermodesulfobacteriota bacterium]|nr:bifunctional precorrin-2 dehydrogenase/sirohydrochlorin ferrochelatase [Thermodesulfobacteriota bacterium]